MIRHKLTIAAVAAAFTLSLAPAWAGQAGSRPNTGSTTGSATPRGGSEGSSSSGGGSTSSSAGSSSSGGSSVSRPSGSSSSSDQGSRARAPERPSSSRAVPRGSAGNSDQRAIGRSGSATAGSDDVRRGRDRNGVPEYSRPRDGRNATGTAVGRPAPLPGSGGNIYVPGIYYPYDPYYSYYYGSYYSRYGYYPYSRYWVPGFGFGLGYFAYDPFMFGGYDPYYYGGGGGYSAGGYSSQYRDVGNIRLKVKPTHAQVHVDGYYVGVVDSFDGVFQKLGIEAGSHRIELRADGYETVTFEVLVTPGETVTYKGEMKPRQP
jgi:hypothetical protein